MPSVARIRSALITWMPKSAEPEPRKSARREAAGKSEKPTPSRFGDSAGAGRAAGAAPLGENGPGAAVAALGVELVAAGVAGPGRPSGRCPLASDDGRANGEAAP